MFQEIQPADFPEKPPLLNGLTPQQMRHWKVLPVAVDDDAVKIAMARPNDLYLIEVLENIYNRPLKIFKANEDDILATIYRWYEADMDISGESQEDEEARAIDELWEDPEQLKDMASEAPVIRLVNHLISQALEVKASDIHFEPYRDKFVVRFRIDGVLHEVETIAKRLQPAITSRIKLMGKMNIAEMRLPQDGRIKVKDRERDIDIRVSTLPTLFGESIVLRLLNRGEVKLELESLGFPPDTLMDFESIIRRPYGLILVTGPTGSGKTTTLYAVMNLINSPDKKIVTVEDPVEYQLDGINQIQVKPKIGLTFANALRTILRQDPDIILIGEIRDAETAEIAIQSALTGHLVFSTLHTNDAPSAITRLQEMGVESYLLASCLLGVMAQRLVRVICPHCKESHPIDEELYQELLNGIEGTDQPVVPKEVWRGKGCPNCATTGYSGRTGIYELLKVDETIRRLIVRGEDSASILKAAKANGMRTLREDGLQKVLLGQTTFEEVLRVSN
ncbi:Type IV fimbrial assembly, ATPase PilB [Dissulfuribacter thermophilus]|uniref:protein-secreting ATPase n=1 Tax=Dissulfuribacter thermophilus TaxID=1156395 RepID=A0A1B9F8S0_9BACT|nr:type II secretion system ATPase GspE [Dissulfuribacter thermophilus]OCC16310.1 Type IV fimbrial assembly, ATPase PilB [Dissulfuribacter thermophilus]